MLLTRSNLKNIPGHNINVPDLALFNLPEKVLQFGTGVLLRGLPDYFIDKANRQGIFNGRIVIVKSTGGDSSAFGKQDNLYTLCIRGIDNGRPVEEDIICSAVSRVLSARDEWHTVLECAQNPQLQIIISNTTEVGIELVHEDISDDPPASYPGKLLSFLYKRYQAFGGNAASGMVIIPTELISDNGKVLKSILLELAQINKLEGGFIEWLQLHNHFCSSLVDRIVPGKPDAAIQTVLQVKLGYTDELLIMSEAYALWAIEGNDQVKNILSFAAADKGVVITPDITLYKELKLRLLNGTHTLSCGIAFLSGFTTVKEAMEDERMYGFISSLMNDEIAAAIPYGIPERETKEFAAKVLDRFSNPDLKHLWISITLNYTSKLKTRVVPVLKQFVKLYGRVPQHMATGFAAYIFFMKAVKQEADIYYGELSGNNYPVNDDKAGWFFEQWQQANVEGLVKNVLSNTSLWDADLTAIPLLAGDVSKKLTNIVNDGMMYALQNGSLKTEQA